MHRKLSNEVNKRGETTGHAFGHVTGTGHRGKEILVSLFPHLLRRAPALSVGSGSVNYRAPPVTSFLNENNAWLQLNNNLVET